ncbi:unnamed protein product [Symbiodinium necroappetens]|uniref:Uncharacterized protein n=1 Tax=Symbiodinium necroappetens TaxID=1628268 RepID=A0A812SCL1_9DINO|nr:unnamed protein product [Symbiodinium necroappetens]
MRLKRLCQNRGKEGKFKCHVDQSVHDDYTNGGEKKEWLEIALVEAIKQVGPESGPAAFKKIKAAFASRIVVVRERLQSKEREIHGEWLTEEKMVKGGEFSSMLCCILPAAATTASAHLFVRWKYDQSVKEYFIETQTKTIVKASDLTRISEIKEREDSTPALWYT